MTSESQFVEPKVSRAKFDRELDEYRMLEREYRQRGWLLLRAEYPHILVALAAPQLTPAAIVTGVQFDYSNYDFRPPSVRLVNPFTEEPYKANEIPQISSEASRQASQPFLVLSLRPALRRR